MTARSRAGRAPQPVTGAGALADGEIDVFQYGQRAEQLIDLERARDAAPRAGGLRQTCDRLAVEQDVAG